MNISERIGLRRTVKAITRRALLIRGLLIAISGLIVITGITYIYSVLYNTSGSFTIRLNKYDMLQSGLSLSEDIHFNRPISRLTAKPLTNVGNISVLDLPDNLHELDGNASTRDYLSYSFYIKNAGKVTVTYEATVRIISATMGIEDAIRVRIYNNGEYLDYAKPKNDGSGPERGTTPFLSQTVVYSENRQDFAPEYIDKYTVVMWLEGDDPECIDDIIGGTIKLQMDFKIVEGS